MVTVVVSICFSRIGQVGLQLNLIIEAISISIGFRRVRSVGSDFSVIAEGIAIRIGQIRPATGLVLLEIG